MKSWTAVHSPDEFLTAAVPTWVSWLSRMLARCPGEFIHSRTMAAGEMLPRAMFSAATVAPHVLMIGPSDWCANSPVDDRWLAHLSAKRSGHDAARSGARPRDVRSWLTRLNSCDSYVELPLELVVVVVRGRVAFVVEVRTVWRFVVVRVVVRSRLAAVVRERSARERVRGAAVVAGVVVGTLVGRIVGRGGTSVVSLASCVTAAARAGPVGSLDGADCSSATPPAAISAAPATALVMTFCPRSIYRE